MFTHTLLLFAPPPSQLAGDFKGATKLVVLILAVNRIVSVAVEAFQNLKAFRVKPDHFNPTNADGSDYTNAIGVGAHLSHACARVWLPVCL